MQKIFIHFMLVLALAFTHSSIAQTNSNLLWEISGNGLKQPSYVFGTIHMICNDDYFMTPVIEEKMKQCQNYYAEINFGDPSTTLAMQQMMITDKGLSKRLDEDNYKKLADLLSENFDLNIQMFENMSDAAIASIITYKSFPCSEFKMYEMELLAMATKHQKKLGGLETVQEQMKIMSASLDIKASIQMLEEIKSKGFEQNKQMVALYKKQAIEDLLEFMKSSSYMTDEVYNKLLTERNANWLKKMPSIMNENPTFFAVGAGHLGGNDGVLQLLKSAGYTVTPIAL